MITQLLAAVEARSAAADAKAEDLNNRWSKFEAAAIVTQEYLVQQLDENNKKLVALMRGTPPGAAA